MIAQLDATVYSFMESMVSIERYVSLGKEYGYSSLGIWMKIISMEPIILSKNAKTRNSAFIGLEMTVHHKMNG